MLLPGWLEVDLAAELKNSRVVGGCHLSKVALDGAILVVSIEGGADVLELRVVPGVKGFQAQFKTAATSFADHEVLEQGNVPVVAAGPTQSIVAESSPSAGCREGELRTCLGSGVEPLPDRVRISNGADQVRAVRTADEVAALVVAESDVDGKTGLHGHDARDLPTAETSLEEMAS